MKTFTGFFGCVRMMQHALARRVQWAIHLSTSDPAIDAQDRNIFELVEEVDELWCHRASGAEFQRVADKAWRVLEAHFRCEERMFAVGG